MNDLRVLFASDSDGTYHVHREGAGGKLGVQASFTPFLEEDDYEDLRWYLEDFMDLPERSSRRSRAADSDPRHSGLTAAAAAVGAHGR